MATLLPSRRHLLPLLASVMLVTACGPDQAMQEPSHPGAKPRASTLIAPPTASGYRVRPAPDTQDGRLGGPLAAPCSVGCLPDSSIVDFEFFTDTTTFHQLTTQYDSLGVLFDSTLVLVAPGYYWQNFPPRSGAAVATADFVVLPNQGSGILYFSLLADAIRVRTYVTSLHEVTLRCFNAGGTVLAEAVFAGANTVETDGGVPNQPVEVSASGIRSCQFDGASNTYSLDDLTVVWVAPVPTLACDTVVRGTTGTCTVTGADSVIWWRYEGLYEVPGYQQAPEVAFDHPSADSVWQGIGVLSGTVSVAVRVGSGTDTLMAPWNVQARTTSAWRWSIPDWKLEEDGTVDCLYTDLLWPIKAGAPSHAGRFGANRRRIDCNEVGVIEPNIRYLDSLGFETAAGAVRDSVEQGPNMGFWYVDSTTFNMDRVSEVRPWIRENHKRFRIEDSTDLALCDSAMGFPSPPVDSINTYNYNKICRGFNPDFFINAILNHEGAGSDPAAANGHMARLRMAAANVANDPRALSENLVQRGPENALKALVASVVLDADNRLDAFASDTTELVRGNYVGLPYAGQCGYFWVWTRPDTSHPKKWYAFYEIVYDTLQTSPPKRCL